MLQHRPAVEPQPSYATQPSLPQHCSGNLAAKCCMVLCVCVKDAQSIPPCLCCMQRTVVAICHISPEGRCKAELNTNCSASTTAHECQASQRGQEAGAWRCRAASQAQHRHSCWHHDKPPQQFWEFARLHCCAAAGLFLITFGYVAGCPMRASSPRLQTVQEHGSRVG